ncbi:MAG: bifunctional diaminohydroxyphosphoribosylaminopyrimidine deaminase/5-amino-6-(5-phosphoribosylamino)uracil reductase RibD [Pseudomonadota bacterium]
MFSPLDQRHMAEALRLAEKGLYTTTPNPRVGCVIVRDGQAVGAGWHEIAGGPHAEILALRAAGESARGATAYVSLEPCSHHGRTSPCADALIDAGIARVVAAMQDPNPRVAGSGFDRLRAAGIRVESGLMQGQAHALNIGFVARMSRGRPWVRMKIAASLDGRTALANGRSQWITGEQARRDGHAWRARACAVLTGIGTVKDDDPRLDVREVETTRQPLKVLVDSRLELPLSAMLLQSGKLLVATAIDSKPARTALEARGAEVVVLPNAQGKVDLMDLMREFGRREINEVHVEAGSKLNGSLLREALVDELLVYLAPGILGDTAQGMFSLPELKDLGRKQLVQFGDVRAIGDDIRIIARVIDQVRTTEHSSAS